MRLSFIALVLALMPAPQVSNVLKPDPDKVCASCAAWNKAREPFRIFGNTYYVGPEGLSSLLVTSDSGHVLLDGGLPQSAALIDRNIRAQRCLCRQLDVGVGRWIPLHRWQRQAGRYGDIPADDRKG